MSVVFVRTEDLPKCPSAFQQYVSDWFRPAVMLGVDVMTCSTLLHWDADLYNAHFRKQHGIGPSHSIDLQNYKMGLNGKSLNEWMSANDKKLVWRAYEAEDHRGGCCVDDD